MRARVPAHACVHENAHVHTGEFVLAVGDGDGSVDAGKLVFVSSFLLLV